MDAKRVVVVGGGVAAVECVLALSDLAGDRVALTIVAPNREFELRPLSIAETFSRDHVRRHTLAGLAKRVGAELVPAAVTAVDAGARHVVAGDRTIPYDRLVVATGGRRGPAYKKAITYTDARESVDYHGLLQDIDEGWSRRVSFVVPPGVTWALPIYELALMTAREAWSMGIDDVDFEIVSPETAPLALFGPQASAGMRERLDETRIAFRGGSYVREWRDGTLHVLPSGQALRSGRVVALPTITGVPLPGVPADDDGFVPVDRELKVLGLDGVFAAGDGTTFPVKQGGIACQQADAIAERIAAEAGAGVEARPFRPVLRGRVLAGAGVQYVEQALHGGDGDGPPSELREWSATRKVDGRYLSRWLEELEAAPSR